MTNRPTYRDACRAFRWEESARALGWAAGEPVNLGRTIVDRHAGGGRPALRWLGKHGEARTYSFDELGALTGRFASLLRAHGVGRGDRVAGFLPRVPEMLIAMIGTWKAGAVYVPIFTGFGPDAVEFRVRHSGARVLVTHREHRARLPEPVPAGVTVITVAGGGAVAPGDAEFWRAMDEQTEVADPVACRRDEPAVLLYTSGSTGPPKGVKIATNFLMAIHPHLVYGADLRPDDVFWPTGDPGWGYGLVCYMGALALGVPVLSHEAAPTPELCVAQLRTRRVSNLATTPTLLRAVMALGPDAVGGVRLRAASSCGEPLNAEVVRFFREHWGVTVMDQYGSSEFGLPVGNFGVVGMAVKPGSMGLPLPGSTMAVVDDDGREVDPDVVGHVGMRPHPEGYYSLGYWNDAERDREMYRGEWMTVGDLARRDADGYFWFEGRADDVIKSAGYRIGPFEVESAILKHEAVAEAAVVGKPDALRGHIVKAYVVLKPGRTVRTGLAGEIADVVKTHVGRHQYPREVEFLDRLPKTETGKIQRFLLRGREASEPGEDAMAAYEVITGGAAWPARYTFSPAVRAGNLLFISGTTAGDEQGRIVGPGDIAAQTRYIFEKFGRLLRAAGGGFEHIVETTDYVTTTEGYARTADVRREFFGGRFPAATGVIVAGLLREGALIEISAVAVLPDRA